MSYGGKGALHGFGIDPCGSHSSPGKTGSLAHEGRSGGTDGTSIAPVRDTAASVIILALPLYCELVSEPKSLNRMPAVPARATHAVTSTGTFL